MLIGYRLILDRSRGKRRAAPILNGNRYNSGMNSESGRLNVASESELALSASPTGPSQTRRRPSRLSTAAVVLFGAAILLPIEYAGRRVSLVCYEHGWPFTYLQRRVVPDGPTDFEPTDESELLWKENRVPWAFEQRLSAWSLSATEPIKGWALAFDLTLAMALLLMLGWLWNRRRKSPGPRTKRFLQFRLRTLLILVALFSVPLGLILPEYNAYHAEGRLLAELQANDSVTIDEIIWRRPWWAPDALAKIGPLGEIFARVSSVSYTPGSTKSHLNRLNQLQCLSELKVGMLPSPDAEQPSVQLSGLVNIRKLSIDLNLNGGPDEVLVVADMPNLRQLVLTDSYQLAYCNLKFDNLPALDEITLKNLSVDQKQLEAIQKTSISSLTFDCCNQLRPEDGSEPHSELIVSGMSRLKHLKVSSCSPSPIPFRHIRDLPTLETLELEGCVDADFTNLPKLEQLKVGGTPQRRLDLRDVGQLRVLSISPCFARWQLTAVQRYVPANPFPIEILGLSHLVNLESFSLPCFRLQPGALTGLANLKTLYEVDFSQSRFTDAELAEIPLQRLAVGQFEDCEISSSGLKALRKATSLKTLDITGVAVSDNAVLRLRRALPTCTVTFGDDRLGRTPVDRLIAAAISRGSTDVNIAGRLYGNADVTELQRIPTEQALSISGLTLRESHVDDDGLESLKPLKNLRRLDLSRTRISDAGLEHLAQLDHLEALDLSDTALTGVGLRYLQQIPRLKALSLSGADFDDEAAAELGKLSALEELHLCGIQIKSKLFDQLAELRNLRAINLSYAGCPVQITKQLARLPRLHVVCLAHLPYAPEFSNLADSSVAVLDAQDSKVDFAAMSDLGTVTSLEELDLAKNSPTEHSIWMLRLLPRLQKLDLNVNDLPDGLTVGDFSSLKVLNCDIAENAPNFSAFKKTHPGLITTNEKWGADRADDPHFTLRQWQPVDNSLPY